MNVHLDFNVDADLSYHQIRTKLWSNQPALVADTDLDSATIKKCPEYDPSKPVTWEYELELFDYYAWD